ncbi:signal transduction histidine kinase [Streptacidiphilus sp. MAP12-20]|uniref:sensor histidine kinase n=1 Tax=Streptacidiphilus sp. MAP12-20 TaxID=3156299 RepID=UPI0035118716
MRPPSGHSTGAAGPGGPEEGSSGPRLWAITDWPTRTAAGHLALALALAAAVTFETIHFANQSNLANLVILTSGLFASACAVPVRRPSLLRRGCAAAIVSLACTALMLGLHPDIHLWGVGEALALLVLLTGVLRRAPRTWALGLGTALAVAAVATPVRDAHPGPVTATVSALTVAVAALSLYLRAQDTARHHAVEDARTAERLELARELHDFVAHHVTGILVQAQTARALPGDPAANEVRLERIEQAAAEALAAMRRVVAVLREQPTGTSPLAGLADIETLVQEFQRTGPPVTVDIDPALQALVAPDLAAGAHRVVREALTNIRKHAPAATEVSVRVRRTGEGLRVEVRNQGGISTPAHPRLPRSGGGFGLLGLTERTAALGGTFEAGPVAQAGWQVTAVFPEQTDGPPRG